MSGNPRSYSVIRRCPTPLDVDPRLRRVGMVGIATVHQLTGNSPCHFGLLLLRRVGVVGAGVLLLTLALKGEGIFVFSGPAHN